MDRATVIYDIERCTCHVPDACRDCSHYTGTVGFGCMEDLMKDALTMLKAQEPQVMTLEEVKAFEWDYCYLEQERQPGNEYRMIAGDYVLTCITWPCIASMRIEYGDGSYGVKWRCWTSRPTDEQRETVKWE